MVETPGETWKQTQEKVQRLLRDDLGMVVIQLELAHRVGGAPQRWEGQPARPHTVVARSCRFFERQQALRNSARLRNTNIYLKEDLCESSVQRRRAQMPELCRAREEGKVAFFVHTRLVIRERRAAADELAAAAGGGHGIDASAGTSSPPAATVSTVVPPDGSGEGAAAGGDAAAALVTPVADSRAAGGNATVAATGRSLMKWGKRSLRPAPKK